MSRTFEFCIPTVGKAVPNSAEWFHEIKYEPAPHERNGSSVRLITKGGYDSPNASRGSLRQP